jgi:transcriptional regulator with XRE-family HTH domain
VGSCLASSRSAALLIYVQHERLLTIRELAQQAGTAPSTIYLIEAGRTVPRLGVVRRLAAALEIDPATIDEFRPAIEAAQAPRATQRSRRTD